MTSQKNTANQLRSDCIELIEKIYRHRLNLALLTRAKSALTMMAAYKGNRTIRSAHHTDD